jgi:hypothetical protein
MPNKRKARKTDNAVLPAMRSNAAGIDIGATEIYEAVPAMSRTCARSHFHAGSVRAC